MLPTTTNTTKGQHYCVYDKQQPTDEEDDSESEDEEQDESEEGSKKKNKRRKDDGGGQTRFFSLPRLLLILLIFGMGAYWIQDWLVQDNESDEETSESMSKRVEEIEKARKDEADFQADFKRSLNPNDSSELTMGSFRYKLWREPLLPFKKANKFCKRMEGRLAHAQKADNLRKLQQLIGRRDVKLEVEEYVGGGRSKHAAWVGPVPKKPKNKSKEEEEQGGHDYMGGGMGGMMGGGGRGGRGEEMCPSISPHSVYVPSPCHSHLPFICQWNRNAPRLPSPSVDDKKDQKEFYRGGRGGGESPYASPDMGRMDDEF